MIEESWGDLERAQALHSGHFACHGCAEILLMRHVVAALGRKTMIVTTAGCGSVVDGPFPYSASAVPFFHCSFGTAASTAAGLKAGLRAQGKDDVTVMAWAGDGGTFDIGLQSLSGAAARNDDILYVCYDNEAYMNTGVHASSATPWGSWTTTSPLRSTQNLPKKDIIGVMVAHQIPYIATATIAFLGDLHRKVRKAAAISGTRFLYLLAPCPPGWKYEPNLSIKVARLAVETGIFPLFEVEGAERVIVNYRDKPLPVERYLKSQGRFEHLTEDDIAAIQREVDRNFRELLDRESRPVKGWLLTVPRSSGKQDHTPGPA